MKVLQVHNFYRTRGGECSVVNAERTLLESYGHEVIPYYRDSRDIDEYGLLTKAYMLLNIPYNKEVERNLEDMIRDVNPDVAHIHNVFPLLTTAVYKVLNRCGVPVVQTIHNFRFLCPNGQFYIHDHICEDCQERGYFSAVKKRCMQNNIFVSGAYAAAIYCAWKKGILPNSIDKYIALNNFFAHRLLHAGVPSSRVSVLGNFVAESVSSVAPKQNYMLYLGRLSREKGILTLLSSWKSTNGTILKIAGTGPMTEEIEATVKQRKIANVQLLGYVTGIEKQNLIKHAICMVVPSEWYENYPISVVEAMSHGTPVVASNIGGLPEMIENEITGMIFEPGNIYALENVLQKLIKDQKLVYNLAQNALNLAKNQYGPQKHYDSLINIYIQLINNENHHSL